MICSYCTPDKKGRRRPLSVNIYRLNQSSYIVYRREVLKIYRDRKNSRDYFIGMYARNQLSDGTLVKNIGFAFKKKIKYCPMCGEKLIKGE